RALSTPESERIDFRQIFLSTPESARIDFRQILLFPLHFELATNHVGTFQQLADGGGLRHRHFVSEDVGSFQQLADGRPVGLRQRHAVSEQWGLLVRTGRLPGNVGSEAKPSFRVLDNAAKVPPFL
ncbi:unnamed protein product, partial [Prunus brigantina]